MRGFTLIELLVVMAIIAILIVVAVPNYNSYTASQKLQEAAGQLQTSLRQAQNNAQSGTICRNGATTSKALDWRLNLATSNGSTKSTSYSIIPTCEIAGATPSIQVINLPTGVDISSVEIKKGSLTCSSDAGDLFQVVFKNISTETTFVDTTGGCTDGSAAILRLILNNNGATKAVKIEKGGGIYIEGPTPTP